MEEKRMAKMPHNIIMEERSRLNVSGVVDIDSFDEETVVAYTDLGELLVKGRNLHINKIDLESGDLSIEGQVYSLSYSDNIMHKSGGGGLFSRLFK